MVTRLGLGAVLALLCIGCQTSRRTLVVPDDMKKKTVKAPATPEKPRTAAEGELARRVYTVRLAESGRVWEVDLPEASGGYQVRVPLSGNGLNEMPTLADQQLGTVPAKATAPDGSDGPALDARTAAAQKSYLGGLARVNELYRARRFELALIELVNLEQAFPEDSRIHAMKGSLLVRLRKLPQAREAYQKALALNPEDIGVAEALRELTEGGE